MRASIALVVVLPFVAEITATPAGSLAASASTAPGSIFQSSFPGSVVPPPRLAARERRPTRRAANLPGVARNPGDRLKPVTDAVLPDLQFAQNALQSLHMVRPRRRHPALAGIDEAALAEFRAGIRRRYTDEQILEQLRASADRLGRSPTMREFAADPEAGMHPQTVIEHFGTWNAAKRAAGLTPRRFISRDELLSQLRQLGEELGRIPTARDLDANRLRVASKSLIWHTFGSLSAALREAGFDVPIGDEKLERAVAQGVELARELRRLPKMADWKEARRRDPEWQVYRLVDIDAGPWAAFQFLVRERLREEGLTVRPDGSF